MSMTNPRHRLWSQMGRTAERFYTCITFLDVESTLSTA